jgi:hypothetical protein
MAAGNYCKMQDAEKQKIRHIHRTAAALLYFGLYSEQHLIRSAYFARSRPVSPSLEGGIASA